MPGDVLTGSCWAVVTKVASPPKVKELVALAVAARLSVMLELELMAVIVVPARMPAPLTTMPTARLLVLAKPVTEVVALVVPVCVTLGLRLTVPIRPTFRQKKETVPPVGAIGEFEEVTVAVKVTDWPKYEPPRGLLVTEDAGAETSVTAAVMVNGLAAEVLDW